MSSSQSSSTNVNNSSTGNLAGNSSPNPRSNPIATTSTNPLSGSGKPYVGMDLTHQSVNGYRVLHRLGVGGMAEVYLAFHETLQRHVALKVLRTDLAASPDHATRFLQEARAAASLIHPNIVQVYDVGSSGSLQFIAQEYIPGVTLRSLIQRNGTLAACEGLSITLQIASALAKASSLGVVHRDIKPDNILLTSEGEVKVADFGLARARSQNSNLTEVGVALGTPLYMSPEQIQGKPVDARSDLYSLGVTAFEMFAGLPPFQGDTPLSLAIQHVQNSPPDLSKLRPDLDQQIIAIINTLLAKNADDRFASATDLIRSIRKVSESLALSVSLEHPYPLSGIVVDMPTAIGEHTTRLQTLALKSSPQTNHRKVGRSKLPWAYAAIVLGIGGLSAYLSSRYDRKPVIEPPQTLVAAVKKQADVREQFFHAMLSNRPADWQAVEEYFPPEDSPIQRNYNVKSWLHIAWSAIAMGNANDAMQATQKILRTPQVEPIIRVSALIARSLIYQKQGKDRESAEELDEAKNEFTSLDENERKLVESSLPAVALNHWYSSRKLNVKQ